MMATTHKTRSQLGSLQIERDDEQELDLPTLVAWDKWLGSYRLCLMLASGGMATVYLARSTGPSLSRYVAVKRLRQQFLTDPSFVSMIMDEARIASQIRHPNVCEVYDYAIGEEACYIVMEYLVGEPLTAVRKALAKDRDLRARSAVYIARMMADICEGLHAAHELRGTSGEPLGVVHRDISLDNLFLTYDGVAKVVDFGIATDTAQKHRTRTGVLKGKLGYIAPETLHGKKPDRRADVWGLGVALWELLTGRRLFRRASDAETIQRVIHCRISPPSQIRPEVPPELDAIVMRALARNPDQRYPTARALGHELLLFLAHRRCAVGLAELSEWMDELFPGGRKQKQDILEIASRLGEEDDVRDVRAGDASEHTPSPATRAASVRPAQNSASRSYRKAWLAVGVAVGVTEMAVGWLWWRANKPSAVQERTRASLSEPAQPVRTEDAIAPAPAPETAAIEPQQPPPAGSAPTLDRHDGFEVLEVTPAGADAGAVMLCIRPDTGRANDAPAPAPEKPKSIPIQKLARPSKPSVGTFTPTQP